MANKVAGEFDAVLQLSGRVLDRLMASLHQNGAEPAGFQSPQSGVGEVVGEAIARARLPAFPHSVFFRIGDPPPPRLLLVIGQQTAQNLQDASQYDSTTGVADAATAIAASGELQQASSSRAAAAAAAMANALDGVRGTVRAQLAVPRLELINAARRFIIEVPIRARYTPDVGTTALPEFIHGTVRAEYSVRELPPLSDGKWRLRVSVIPASVSFQSYGPDTSDDARIARQIARLLQTRFVPADEHVGFRLHTIKPMAAGGFSAVTIALPIGDEEPQGSLDTFASMLLQGNDFAFGVNAALIEAVANQAAATLQGQGVHTTGEALDLLITVQNATATYSFEGGNAGTITITATIRVQGVLLTMNVDFSFDVTQRLTLEFDPAARVLTLKKNQGVKLPPWVKVAAQITDSLGFLDAKVDAAINTAQSELAKISGLTGKLNELLRQFDAWPRTQLTSAGFEADGMILRGKISLAARIAPVVEFGKLSTLDGYSACPSWLPGGRIDSFHWRWSWFYPTQSTVISPPAQGASTLTHMDRFIMRPQGSVPGLHAAPASLMTGAVCLNVRGVQIDAQSGDPVQVDTSVMALPRPVCQFFSPNLQMDVPLGRGRLLSRLHQKRVLEPKTVWPEVALLDLGNVISEGQTSLVCYFHEPPRAQDFGVLRRAIEESGRRDSGLLVAVVLGEAVALPDRVSELGEAIAAMRAYVLVAEDVQRGWASAFDIRGDRRGFELRLVTPGGRIAWSSDAPAGARELAAALREHVVAAPFPELQPVAVGVQPGFEPPATWLELAPSEGISLRALRGSAVVLCFVRTDSESSNAQIAALDRQADVFARRSALVVAIVADADASAARALKETLAVSHYVAGDPDGAITRRWGIRLWPTTVVINEQGIVERVQLGAEFPALDELARQPSAR